MILECSRYFTTVTNGNVHCTTRPDNKITVERAEVTSEVVTLLWLRPTLTHSEIGGLVSKLRADAPY